VYYFKRLFCLRDTSSLCWKFKKWIKLSEETYNKEFKLSCLLTMQSLKFNCTLMAKLTLMRKMWFNPALFVPLRNENGLLKSFSICKTILRPIIFLTPTKLIMPLKLEMLGIQIMYIRSLWIMQRKNNWFSQCRLFWQNAYYIY